MKNIVLATVAMSFAATVANAGIVSVNEQSRANIIKFCEQGSERHCSGLIGDTVYTVVNGEILELGTAKSFAGKTKEAIKEDVTSTIVEKVVVEQIEVVKTETVEKIVEVSKSGDVAKIAELSAQIVQADQLIDALRSDYNVLADAWLSAEQARVAAEVDLESAQAELATANAGLEIAGGFIGGIYDEAARRGVVTPNAYDYSSSEQYGKNVAYRIYAKGRADRGEQLLPLLREARDQRDEANAYAEELEYIVTELDADIAAAKAVSTVGTGDNYDTYIVGGSVSEVLAYSFTSTTNTVAGGFGTEQNTVSTRVIYDDTSVDLDVAFEADYSWFNHGWFINGALQAAVDAAVEVAFEAGYEAGYDAGYQAGYADGFADGVASVQSQL